ncbi:MAG: hypothetical protein HUU02_14420 [Bacteroidetes bacterium]|nr:hypothetical protein [Bacteroidota bacterium]
MGYLLTLILFFLFLVLSVNVWGTVMIDPINLGAFNIHLVDICFLGFAAGASLRMRKYREHFHGFERVIGGPFMLFLLWTLGLAFYSIIGLGQGVNNTIRFLIGTWYMSVYFLLPAIAKDAREMRTLLILLLLFLSGSYFINLFQNLTGWHPASSLDQTMMSYTVDYGGIYRTWNPTQMWLIGLTAFTLTRVYYDRVTMGRLTALFFMLIFLAFTFFRSYYLGFAAALVFLFTANVKPTATARHRSVMKTVFNIIRVGVAAYLLVWGVFQLFPIVQERMASAFVEIAEGSGTFAHRIRLLALSTVYMDSIFMGGGYATLEYTNKMGSAIDFLIASLSSGADSGIINLFFRFGLIGLSLYLFVTWRLFSRTLSRLRSCEIGDTYTMMMTSLVYTVWVWVGGIANNTFTSVANAPVLVTLWAINDIAWNLHRRRSETPPTAESTISDQRP